MQLGRQHKLPMPPLVPVLSDRCDVRLKAYFSFPEVSKAHQDTEAIRINSSAQASICSVGPNSMVSFQETASTLPKIHPRGCRSTLCRTSHSRSFSPRLSGRRKSSNSKAWAVTALGPGLPFASQIGHAAIRTMMAICHAGEESERDLGGNWWLPEQAERQTAEMLPATALPRCPQQSQHAWSGQGLFCPLF